MTVIVPSMVRLSIVGTYLDRPCVNVLDMVAPENQPSIGEREEVVQYLAEYVLGYWDELMLPALNSSYVAQRVDYVDFSQTDGVTGSVTSVGEISWPRQGERGDGHPYSPMAAMLVTKETGSRRGQRPGRWYLAPPGESQVNQGMVENTFLPVMQGALDDLHDALSADAEGMWEFWPVVSHIQTGATTGTTSPITRFSLRARLATQRRRNSA